MEKKKLDGDFVHGGGDDRTKNFRLWERDDSPEMKPRRREGGEGVR